MKTVSLEVIQLSTGPVCPGQEVILTCNVAQTAGYRSDIVFDMELARINPWCVISYQ